MHNSLESQLNRRTLLIAAAAAMVEAVSTNSWASGNSVNLNFYASRSGRFGNKRNSLLIGGILILADAASQLEIQLNSIAEELDFRIPLQFSTNSHNPIYYERALKQFMMLPDAIFAGVQITTPDFPDRPEVRQAWRTEAEERVFKEIIKKGNVTVMSLRHDFDADIQIYKDIGERLPSLTNFDLLKSYKHGTRIMELSSCICKALAKPERLILTPNSNKYLNEICLYTYNAFNIREVNSDIVTSKLTLKNVST